VKSPHELDIDWLEPVYQLTPDSSELCSLRVTSRLNKVDTSVYTIINELEPVDSVLLLEVGIESSIDIVHDRFPATCQLSSREA
jgi:hypothetical protein